MDVLSTPPRPRSEESLVPLKLSTPPSPLIAYSLLWVSTCAIILFQTFKLLFLSLALLYCKSSLLNAE